MTIQEAIVDVCAKRDLSAEEMIAVMRLIMTGEATDAQIGAMLMGLRMKGETIDEIVGAASVMRELSQKVDVLKDFLVDTCGTGRMVQISLTYLQRRRSLLQRRVVGLRSTVTARFLQSQDRRMF